MKLQHCRLLPIILILLAVVSARAQETAQFLAQKLQQQFLSAPGVLLSFQLKNEGIIRITADLRGGHIRLESPALLILSDGKTIWNYDKVADRVTIDNVTSTSEFHDPSSLFRFSENYTPSIISQSGGGHYTIDLTPRKELQSLLHSAGEMQSLQLDVQVRGSRMKILKASATSSRGTAQIEQLKITTLTHASATDFIFKAKASTKIVDLRE